MKNTIATLKDLEKVEEDLHVIPRIASINTDEDRRAIELIVEALENRLARIRIQITGILSAESGLPSTDRHPLDRLGPGEKEQMSPDLSNYSSSLSVVLAKDYKLELSVWKHGTDYVIFFEDLFLETEGMRWRPMAVSSTIEEALNILDESIRGERRLKVSFRPV